MDLCSQKKQLLYKKTYSVSSEDYKRVRDFEVPELGITYFVNSISEFDFQRTANPFMIMGFVTLHDKETGCSFENIQRYKQFGCKNFWIYFIVLTSDLNLIYITGLTIHKYYFLKCLLGVFHPFQC